MELWNICSFHRKFLTRNVLHKFGVLIWAFCYLLDSCVGYNLDIETATVHSGESRSKFGYSVALHQDQGAKWLLIGAPRAQTRQPGVTRGGAVYRCPIDSGSYCQEIPFDTKGNDIRHNGTHYRDVEDKSDQWFGASLKSSLNGIIVACAPRYVYFSTRLDKREPVGTCFVARSSSTDYEEYSPCRSRVDGLPLITDQFHQQGYCQAGFSASLTSEGRQLLVGAVGSWYWQGQLFNFNFEDGPGRYEATPESRKDKDYEYMGYASAIGHFDGDTMEDYVVGVPRGKQLQGKVVIYTQNLTLIDTIKGGQFGSYFGYAVEVEDLDQNGLDDIIVGAPLFSDFDSDSTYETGRVYIYYQNSKRRFSKKNKDILDGHHSRSRFGQALCALGDIDLDGYKDLAVGAPYGGEDGRGAVYIYHGSMRGIITDVQQIIQAEDVLQGIETFGWSLSGSLDMDLNEYPDLLIGAQESNKALFLRSRPVVRVTPSISIKPANITLETDPKHCFLVDGTPVICVTGYACISYTGVGVPDTLDFELKWKLDALKNDSSRLFFLHSETTREETLTITYFRDEMKCETALGYLVNDVRDKLTPLVIDFTFELVERKNRNKREVRPILNQRTPAIASAEANIMKKCGLDNICVPDLAVTAVPVSDSHILGQKVQRGKTEGMLHVLVFVENRGEESYESMLNITLPAGVSFFRITDRKYEIPMSCTPPENSSSMFCDLGNPLPSKSKTNFTLWVNPKDVTGDISELVFEFNVSSSNKEANDTKNDTRNNNKAIAKIPIKQRADINIGGKASPEQVIYSDSDVKRYRATEEVGPVLVHRYFVSNGGPTAVETSIVKINWPSTDSKGLNLLYLLADTPEVSRPDISCIMYNDTITKYSDSSEVPSVILSQKGTKAVEDSTRRKRDIVKRSRTEFKNYGCVPGVLGCTYIHCTIGHMKPQDSVEIIVRARIWTSTLIQKKIKEPFYFVSSATAEVLSMPFPKLDITPGTLLRHIAELATYVNPEKLHPKKKGIEPWIIGVAVSAGLLLLFLLIMILWWCGFFQRKRPEDKAYLAPQNGEYKSVPGAPPDERYKYM